MAARDGSYREGFYHFKCESCGAPATARRAHARVCSNTCAARLRRTRTTVRRDAPATDTEAPTEFRFYISQRKLEAILRSLGDGQASTPELVVGFDRGGRGPELARLQIDTTDHDDGGLVCCLTAPYDPFGERGKTRARAKVG